MDVALPPSFFKDSAVVVAQKLIGCRLCCYVNGQWRSDTITETEAYLGTEDLASHARFGKTKRNAPMFGAPGIWYVYQCYGMHAMLNIVTEPSGHPAAVLIRSIKTIQGPGRLTKALSITTAFNQTSCHPNTHLYIRSAPPSDRQTFSIQSAPRIGVAYAGPIWSNKPYRFIAKFQ